MKNSNVNDQVLKIASQLLRIDNRPVAELAKATGLTPNTIRRVRDMDCEYAYTTTVSRIAHAMHKNFKVM